MSEDVRICGLVPTYDNPDTVATVVAALRAHLETVIVVDDGSGPEGRAAVAALGERGEAVAVHRAQNGGKGAAVKTGLEEAHRRGFSHALQIDADGQHDVADIPTLLAAARARPDALILGAPRFDDTAPRGRRVARKITMFWVHLETGGRVIDDAMCGFRVYPVEASLAVSTRGDMMDFDPEIAVRLHWAGLPIVNVPTQVRYFSEDEGGVSHFRLFTDNVRISWMHTRLMWWRVNTMILRRRLPKLSAKLQEREP